jgi:hypothetical protein
MDFNTIQGGGGDGKITKIEGIFANFHVVLIYHERISAR